MDMRHAHGTPGSKDNRTPHRMVYQGIVRVHCPSHSRYHYILVTCADREACEGATENMIRSLRLGGNHPTGIVAMMPEDLTFGAHDFDAMDRYIQEVRLTGMEAE